MNNQPIQNLVYFLKYCKAGSHCVFPVYSEVNNTFYLPQSFQNAQKVLFTCVVCTNADQNFLLRLYSIVQSGNFI